MTKVESSFFTAQRLNSPPPYLILARPDTLQLLQDLYGAGIGIAAGNI